MGGIRERGGGENDQSTRDEIVNNKNDKIILKISQAYLFFIGDTT